MTHGELVFERILERIKELRNRGEEMPRVPSPGQTTLDALVSELKGSKRELLSIPPDEEVSA